ncbi:hypothetical protein [Thiolapillus sp.]
MNPFEMVVIIVALGILGGVLNSYFSSGKDKQAMRQTNEELAGRLAQVEKRLEVLERIVTSNDYELKRQFRDLEDD